jgi:hypothetical protein
MLASPAMIFALADVKAALDTTSDRTGPMQMAVINP